MIDYSNKEALTGGLVDRSLGKGYLTCFSAPLSDDVRGRLLYLLRDAVLACPGVEEDTPVAFVKDGKPYLFIRSEESFIVGVWLAEGVFGCVASCWLCMKVRQPKPGLFVCDLFDHYSDTPVISESLTTVLRVFSAERGVLLLASGDVVPESLPLGEISALDDIGRGFGALLLNLFLFTALREGDPVVEQVIVIPKAYHADMVRSFFAANDLGMVRRLDSSGLLVAVDSVTPIGAALFDLAELVDRYVAGIVRHVLSYLHPHVLSGRFGVRECSYLYAGLLSFFTWSTLSWLMSYSYGCGDALVCGSSLDSSEAIAACMSHSKDYAGVRVASEDVDSDLSVSDLGFVSLDALVRTHVVSSLLAGMGFSCASSGSRLS